LSHRLFGDKLDQSRILLGLGGTDLDKEKECEEEKGE